MLLSPVKVILLFTISALTLCTFGLALPGVRANDRNMIEIKFVNPNDLDLMDIEYSKMLEMTQTSSMRGQFSYTIGQRMTGDKLVAQEDDTGNYPAAKDVSVTLIYPKSGTGLTLTYVFILVDQSSDVGGAYVIDGAIGQKTIQILVVANQTSHFSHSAAFYGY